MAQLFASNNAAFDDVAGSSPGQFDFGAPPFLGRRVFVAIAGQATPGGTGPYFAF